MVAKHSEQEHELLSRRDGNFRTRAALQIAFYDLLNDYRWYVRRGGANKDTLMAFLERWVIMLYPFIPHVCEEIWELLGHYENISGYPELIDVDEGELEKERYIMNLFDDIKAALQALPIKPKKLYLYCIPGEEDNIDTAFLEKELECAVDVQPINRISYDPGARAKRTKKSRPAIYVE